MCWFGQYSHAVVILDLHDVMLFRLFKKCRKLAVLRRHDLPKPKVLRESVRFFHRNFDASLPILPKKLDYSVCTRFRQAGTAGTSVTLLLPQQYFFHLCRSPLIIIYSVYTRGATYRVNCLFADGAV